MRKNIILKKIHGKILLNEPLRRHTTFRTGGPCKIWVEPEDETELRRIVLWAKEIKKKIFVIGTGSNVLARDKGFNGIVLHLGHKNFRKITIHGSKVQVGAGARLDYLINKACKMNLGGIEGLIGIPGTLGGAIYMNATYKGSISDCLEVVRVMEIRKGTICNLKRKDLKVKYRHSGLDDYVILEATLNLQKASQKILLDRKIKFMEMKQKTQPLGLPSAGCVFKNPAGKIAAARYIELLNLKGEKIGDAKVSKKHANFIVNLKNAKANDILRLIRTVKRRVKSRFNIDLALEIKIL